MIKTVLTVLFTISMVALIGILVALFIKRSNEARKGYAPNKSQKKAYAILISSIAALLALDVLVPASVTHLLWYL